MKAELVLKISMLDNIKKTEKLKVIFEFEDTSYDWFFNKVNRIKIDATAK